jgi:hypothetical protein
MGVGGQHHTLAAFTPGKTRYPLYWSLGRPRSRSGQVRKIFPPPRFDPRTFQPVASRYTDYAIPAPFTVMYKVHTPKIFIGFMVAFLSTLHSFVVSFNLETVKLLSTLNATHDMSFSRKTHSQKIQKCRNE